MGRQTKALHEITIHILEKTREFDGETTGEISAFQLGVMNTYLCAIASSLAVIADTLSKEDES